MIDAPFSDRCFHLSHDHEIGVELTQAFMRMKGMLSQDGIIKDFRPVPDLCNTCVGSRVDSSNVDTGVVPTTTSPILKLEWKKILKGNGQSCISVYFLYLLLMM